jgi:hypothetical protein
MVRASRYTALASIARNKAEFCHSPVPYGTMAIDGLMSDSGHVVELLNGDT